MDLGECKVYFKNRFNLNVVDDKHICAGSERSGSCHGDSGGPLTQVRNGRHILDGLVSFGSVNSLNQCDDTTKQVYLRTEYFLDWITENSIAGEVCNK
ncbi:mast cell protease 2-like protein [Leptotrombidium deliense]|uniref:Mast cell protease 2-like protein n=1 Tax=Leptotrombidium deliense TaxID=299467 RepID=A0A443S6H8_9ACAR|nr:mast cell protease 2-like protein [Leptotrombidium deliense]